MPFKSSRQRRFMHAKHPQIAARWEREAKRQHKAAVSASASASKKGKKK